MLLVPGLRESSLECEEPPLNVEGYTGLAATPRHLGRRRARHTRVHFRSWMKPEANLALEGRTIADKFLIESIIGKGAMGAVYRARWVALEKIVALKVMHPDIAKDEAFTARFHREAKAASRLEHPNSVRVLDFGQEPDGLLYIAMEYLAGKDLLALMRDEWPLPGERITSASSCRP